MVLTTVFISEHLLPNIVNVIKLNCLETKELSNPLPGQSMWDLWWTKWHWDRFFPCQFHSAGAPLLGKIKKLIIFLFIFITGLHNKP
jgi:hypothetical protein